MRAQPLWLDAGPDECEFCSRFYYVEVGYYCIDCDRPLCPLCVVTVFEGQSLYCPECHPADESHSIDKR